MTTVWIFTTLTFGNCLRFNILFLLLCYAAVAQSGGISKERMKTCLLICATVTTPANHQDYNKAFNANSEGVTHLAHAHRGRQERLWPTEQVAI